MYNDGTKKYNNANDNFDDQVGGCPADFRLQKFPTKAKVKYVRDQFLQILLNVQEDGLWRDCVYSTNITLPLNGYIGFSALTGELHGFYF